MSKEKELQKLISEDAKLWANATRLFKAWSKECDKQKTAETKLKAHIELATAMLKWQEQTGTSLEYANQFKKFLKK